MSLGFLESSHPDLVVIEVRGPAPHGAISIGPERSLLIGAEVDGQSRHYDRSDAYVCVEVESAELLRRVTELETFPAVGSVLRGTPAVIIRSGEGFRVLVPRELGQYVRETIDELRGGL
jgi:hypothetical protein